MVWWQDGLVATEDGLVARWFGGKMVWWRDDHKPYDSTDPVSRHILKGAFPSLPARGERLFVSWLYVGATSSTSSHSR